MSLTSLTYWLVILGLAAILALAYVVVVHERWDLPGYGAAHLVALSLYMLAWIALGTLTTGVLFFGSLNVVGLPPLWTVVPGTLTVAVLATIIGGHLVAWAFGARRAVLHPRRVWKAWRARPRHRRALRADEMRTAEAYDAEWQIADRKRNQRMGSGPSL